MIYEVVFLNGKVGIWTIGLIKKDNLDYTTLGREPPFMDPETGHGLPSTGQKVRLIIGAAH